MKLVRLKLNTPFRSLPKGFEVDFLRAVDRAAMWDFMPYCLVGRNGSGKSNVLEALAAIFYHIECIYLNFKPEGFEKDADNQKGFDAEIAYPDAYQLEYYIEIPIELIKKTVNDLENKPIYGVYAHILVEKKPKKRPVIQWLNRAEYDSAGLIELNSLEIRQLTPQYIVGYSSGENEILSLPFFKMRFIHFDEFADKLIQQTGYTTAEGRLVYVDNTYSQAVFLTNYLMQDPHVLKPIHDTLHIEAIKTFRIILNRNIDISERLEGGFSNDFSDDFLTSNAVKKHQLVDQLGDITERLRLCATCYNDASDRILYLDYCIGEATREAFKFHFENDALKLFQAFQILLTLNLYDVSFELKRELYQSDSLYVNETVPVLASDKRVTRFKDVTIQKKDLQDIHSVKSLSDGEHQYLHAMGLCLLFKNTNTLFLLDEPETHFNPDWRAKFISTLRDCLKDEGKHRLRDLLITSHSPFIISDCKQENVLVFQRDTEGARCERPKINTFGTSVNILTEEIFNKNESIGDLAMERINKIYEEVEDGKIDVQEAKEQSRELGESVEKVLLFRKLILKEKNNKKDA